MEIQQASWYAKYIERLGWQVEKLGSSRVFLRRFPFIGALAKIQRIQKLPPPKEIRQFVARFHIQTLAIEPDSAVPTKRFQRWIQAIAPFANINQDYFLPTKTIRVSLTSTPDEIFQRLSEAKRRAVRRAQKNNLHVGLSGDIEAFIQLKNRSVGFLGFITTFGIRKLWRVVPEKQKMVLLAHTPKSTTPVAGILILIYNRIAYYWIAGATKQGKKMFAPTLLVWQALLASKERGCIALDFVGVWDERMPKKNKEWSGFTKFKEGFGGESLYYPLH